MTRKRFIKLLMGRYGCDRDAARNDAQLIQGYQHQRELTNRSAKTLGMPKEKRMPMHGYEYIWRNYYERFME